MSDLAERFFSCVDKDAESPCWVWTGPMFVQGYGCFNVGRANKFKAHRWSWEYHNKRPIPKGLVVCHSCDNKRCINPDHLRAATQAFNNREAIERGRWKPNIGEKNGRAILTPEQVREVRSAPGSQQAIADRLGIAQSHVSRIKRGESWASI